MKFGISRPLLGMLGLLAAGLIVTPATYAQTDWKIQRPASVPDLAGVWQKSSYGSSLPEEEPPFTEWGRERFDLALPGRGPTAAESDETNAPEVLCEPMGIPATYFRPRPFELIQLPGRVIMLIEVENFFRVIYTDGREFPEFPLPTWNGYAIGHYEGDTLVVETRNFRGWQSEDRQRWVDRMGHPFSEELTVIERFRRIDHETLENEITIIDPVAYERPWSATMTFSLREGVELEEFICSEADNREFQEFERQLLEYNNQDTD
jgi:hypothetical protein